MPSAVPPADPLTEVSLSIISRLFSRFSVQQDLLCCVFCAPVFITLADQHFPHRVSVFRYQDTARNIFYRVTIADLRPAFSDFRAWSAFQSDVSHPSISKVPRLQSTSYDSTLWKTLGSANAVIAYFLPCRNAQQRYGRNHLQRGYFTCDATSHGTRFFGGSRALGEKASTVQWEPLGSPARGLDRLRTGDLRAAADWEFKKSIPIGCGTIDSWIDGIGEGIIASPTLADDEHM